MGMSMRTKFLLGTFLAISIAPLAAHAHWCNDMWSSAYNIVVRPATDTVTVPASGSGSLDIYVQNNMGYQLTSFTLTATMGSGTITATRGTQTTAGVLLPGEKSKYTLAITKSGGGAVSIGDISFAVKFGNSGQSADYPAGGGKAVMIRETSGTLVPAAPPPGIGSGLDMSRQIQYAAEADFSGGSTGLNNLMSLYCAGRGSWGANDASVITGACSGTATDCTKATRALTSGTGTKYDYTKLWAAIDLGARKSGLGANLATLRTRLQCGAGDANVAFAGVAMMVLGFLGDDPTARTFLVGKTTDATVGTIAKAALMLFSAADATQYDCGTAGTSSSSVYVKAACLAAKAIANNDDASATTLIGMVKWSEPDTDNAQGLYPAQLLSLTAWARRVWAANAGDTGEVSFYAGATPSGGSTGTGAGGSTGAANGGSTGMASGGRSGTASGGSTGMANGGSTGMANGGSTGTPTAGIMATGGRSGAASGGSTGMATGGSTGMAAGGSTGMATGGIMATGGKSGTASGGTTGTPTGGSTGTPTAGIMAAGGKSATASGGSGTPTAGSPSGGASGQAENGGSQGSGTANQSESASGCSCRFAPSGQAPIGLLLAGVGLALAVRRRRHR
jgi:MYXO-CTERM domain-containing protein